MAKRNVNGSAATTRLDREDMRSESENGTSRQALVIEKDDKSQMSATFAKSGWPKRPKSECGKLTSSHCTMSTALT